MVYTINYFFYLFFLNTFLMKFTCIMFQRNHVYVKVIWKTEKKVQLLTTSCYY